MKTHYPKMRPIPDPGTTKEPGGGSGYIILVNEGEKLIGYHPAGYTGWDFITDAKRARIELLPSLTGYAVACIRRSITSFKNGEHTEKWEVASYSDPEIHGDFHYPGEPKPTQPAYAEQDWEGVWQGY